MQGIFFFFTRSRLVIFLDLYLLFFIIIILFVNQSIFLKGTELFFYEGLSCGKTTILLNLAAIDRQTLTEIWQIGGLFSRCET